VAKPRLMKDGALLVADDVAGTIYTGMQRGFLSGRLVDAGPRAVRIMSNEGTQGGRDLAVPGIIEEQSLERWRPVFQDADQLSGAQERLVV
jgi:hypothetical protein